MVNVVAGIVGWRTFLAGCVLMVMLVGCQAGLAPSPGTPAPSSLQRAPLRIFWVNSYALDTPWSSHVRIGILDALNRFGYQYSDNTLVWSMYNMNVTPELSARDLMPLTDRAITAIQAFEPDVVIISDDEAAEAIVPRYPDPDVKFVLCGVHPEVDRRGLLRDNVVAVIEQIYPVQTVEMAQTFMAAGWGTYLIIGDHSGTGQVYTRLAYDALLRLQFDNDSPPPAIGIAQDWAAWQDLILNTPDNADFILIANYTPLMRTEDDANTAPGDVLDAQPLLVSASEMMRWTLDHAPVPVFALTRAPVTYGAIGGLVPHGYEQGYLAGEMAVQFVEDADNVRGQMVVASNRLTLNAAAARYWGLPIPILFPIAAEVHEYLPPVQGGM
jgi:hypothetical protein